MNVPKSSRARYGGLITLVAGSLLATTLTAPAQVAAAVDDFTTVAPIANPVTPDQEFFNMRLQYFLPETEPLIKQTFGSTLTFDDSAFWQYPSYYSCAVSFATNLPALAKIDYGADTSYGQATQQTESYFYQNTLYLTGLQPGTTYHYQIKAKGSDGAFTASDDKTCTTLTLMPDVIRIPDDLTGQSAPYRLRQGGTATAPVKYVLTQDLTVPNGGIIIDASFVDLDLGGHTISYDNAPNTIINEQNNSRADFMYGINDQFGTFGVRSGLWNLTNQNIFNGKIVQGTNGGAGIAGTGYNPIYSIQSSYMEIAGVTIDYYGDNINGMDVSSHLNIHNNVVYDRGTGIDLRDQQMRAITAYDGTDHTNVTEYNSVRRCRQVGITTGGEQKGNEVYGDSYSTNSFLIAYASNSTTEGNKIFGLGYMPIGIGGGNMTNAVARNNFIYVNAYAPSQRFAEYGRTSGAVGFRPQVYATATGQPNPSGLFMDNTFEDNVVVAKAWPGSAYIRALWVGSDNGQAGMVVSGNTVKAETMTDDIDTSDGGYSFSCIEFQGWDQVTSPPVVMFTDNTLITNVTFIAFGSGYGIGNNGSFYNTTFEKIAHNSTYYQPIRMGFWYWNSINNKLIDSVAGLGVDLSLPPVNISYDTTNDLSLDVGISSTRTYATAGGPLANATVTWTTDGGDSGSFTTTAAGLAANEWITTHNAHNAGDPGQTMTQLQNETITFTVAGYPPVTKAIADLQGTGPDVVFGAAAPTVTGVTVAPATVTVNRDATQQFTVTVAGTNNPSQAVTWQVSGGGTGTSISSTGLLTVAYDETASSLTVTATSVLDDTKSGTATVTVPAPVPCSGINGSLTSSDSLVPWSGNGGYDVSHYNIDLTFQKGPPVTISGETTINATVTGQPLCSFGLDLLGLNVSRVVIDGNAAHFYRLQDAATNMYKLVVTPTGPITGDFTVAVVYSGEPQQFVFHGSSNFAVGWLPDQAFSSGGTTHPADGGGVGLGEPVGAFAWYPVNATPTDKASYTTILTAPNDFQAVGIGKLVSTAAVSTDQTQWTWDEPDAVPSSFTIAAIGNYEAYTDTYTTTLGNTVPIDIRTDPGIANGGAVPTHYMALTKQLLDWGETNFGPYCPAVAGYVMKPTSVSYALEVYGKPFYTGDWGDSIYAHEFAHQWGGNCVTVADWSDLWLAEGFATYVQWLWAEDNNGSTVADQAASTYNLADTNSLWSVAPAGMTSQSQMFGSWNYEGGALALAALREGIGPDLMDQVLQTWFATYAGGNASTQDFIDVAESVTGADLTQWAHDYLFTAGKPPSWPAPLSYLPVAQTDIASASVDIAGGSAYTGAALTPAVTVTLGGATLVAGTDYTVAYSNNTDAGTATVTVTGIGSYTGTATAQFTIAPRVITFAVDPIADQTYTGSPIIPPVVVRDGMAPVPTSAYTVAYADNTDAGTATVTVTGVGNYAGSTGTVTFVISTVAPPAQPQTLTFDQAVVTKTFGDAAFTNALTQVGAGALSFTSTNPAVAGVDGTGLVTIVGAGSASITVMAAEVAGEWLEASASYTLTVAPLTLPVSTVITVTGSTAYTSAPLTPTVTVSVGGTTLVEGTDYTVAYSNNTDPGEATVTVTGVGNYAGQVIGHFTITPPAPTLTLSQSTWSVAAGAASTNVAVTTNQATWTVDSDQTWLTVTQAAGTLILGVAANPSAAGRTATATVTASGLTAKVAVTQAGAKLTVAPSGLVIDSTGGAQSIAVSSSSGLDWQVTGLPAWLTAAAPSGSATTPLALTVAPFTGSPWAARTATITVAVVGTDPAHPAQAQVRVEQHNWPGPAVIVTHDGAPVTQVQVGWKVTGVAAGFQPGESVRGTMQSFPLDLGTQKADANGVVQFTWVIPADTPAGTHTFVATGSSQTMRGTFNVPAAPKTPPAPAAAGAGVVVETGGVLPGGHGGWAPLVLLVAAAMAVALGVRRRTAI